MRHIVAIRPRVPLNAPVVGIVTRNPLGRRRAAAHVNHVIEDLRPHLRTDVEDQEIIDAIGKGTGWTDVSAHRVERSLNLLLRDGLEASYRPWDEFTVNSIDMFGTLDGQ